MVPYDDLFRGWRFRLDGFDEKTEDQLRASIARKGGSIEKKNEWNHLVLVLCSKTVSYSAQICVDARKNGAIIVNEFWLEECLACGAWADTTKILYRPPISLEGIKGANNLLIGHFGFSSSESAYLEGLINMMGAYVAKKETISRCSYLIYQSSSGEKHTTETEGNALIVTKDWLEHCVKEWDIVSVDNYLCKSSEIVQLTPRTPRNYRKRQDWSEPDIRMAWSSEKKRKEGTEDSNCGKRHASSAGRTKPSAQKREADAVCRKRLNFNWRLLSEYKHQSELILTVQIPESSREKEIGTEVIKEALLRAYTELSNIHLSGECIKNTFTTENIRVSLDSDEAAFENAQLVVYSEELARSNRQQFIWMAQKLFRDHKCSVPADIAGWLSCISSGVPDRVLKRHINMLDPNSVFASFLGMYYIVARLREENLPMFNLVIHSKPLLRYINWKKRFTWRPLDDSLRYINPNKLELHNLKIQSQTGEPGQSSCKPKLRHPSVFGLLEVIRDCFIHPARLYQALLLPILLIQHPNLLSDLQIALCALCLLK